MGTRSIARAQGRILRAGGMSGQQARTEARATGEDGAMRFGEFRMCRERGPAVAKACIARMKIFRNTNHGASTAIIRSQSVGAPEAKQVLYCKNGWMMLVL